VFNGQISGALVVSAANPAYKYPLTHGCAIQPKKDNPTKVYCPSPSFYSGIENIEKVFHFWQDSQAL